MLEQVSEPGLAFALVAGPDTKPRVIRDHGRRMVLASQKLEPVREPKPFRQQAAPERHRLQVRDSAVRPGRSVDLLEP